MGLLSLKQVAGGGELQTVLNRVASGDLVSRRQLEVFVGDAVGVELSAVLTASGGGYGTWSTTEYAPFSTGGNTAVEEYDDTELRALLAVLEARVNDYHAVEYGVTLDATGNQFGAFTVTLTEPTSSASSGGGEVSEAEFLALKADVERLVSAFAASNATVLGIRLKAQGTRYGAWDTVDAELNALNGDALEVDETVSVRAAVGIQLVESGGQFGTWSLREVTAGNVSGGSGGTGLTELEEELVNLKTQLADYKLLVSDLLTGVHEKIALYNPVELGARRLSPGLRYGQWLTVDRDGNGLNGDALEVDVPVQVVLGAQLTDSSVQFGTWTRYGNISDAVIEL